MYINVRPRFLNFCASRTCTSRYVVPGTISDVATAVSALLDTCALCPHSLTQHDCNQYRRTRLYTREMELVAKENQGLLMATYKLYKANDRAKFLAIEHWVELLDAMGVMGWPGGVSYWVSGVGFLDL